MLFHIPDTVLNLCQVVLAMPSIYSDIFTDDLERRLTEGKLDIVIQATRPARPGLEEIILYDKREGRVEDRLDQQLVQLIVPSEPVVGEESVEELSPEEDADYKNVAAAVMRESIINLARIKETFTLPSLASDNSAQRSSKYGLIVGLFSVSAKRNLM